MSQLQQFNGDSTTKEELINFIHEYINTTALERMYEGHDVSHIKDAKALIDGAFEHLKELYTLPERPIQIVNEAK